MGRRSSSRGGGGGGGGIFFYLLKRAFRSRTIIISLLVCIALFPPFFLHFRITRLHQIQVKKCGWLKNPPLVCAHGGDSVSTWNAFPNTMAAYESAIRSGVDCIEIDVSRSSDGLLFALHDRDLQRISGNTSSKVGHFTMKQIKELATVDTKIPTIEDALEFVSDSVRQVILDVKVGPPSYEKGLAKDILSVVKRTRCNNCLVWAKSDDLARDVIKQSSDTMALDPCHLCGFTILIEIFRLSMNLDTKVGYIVMIDPMTGRRASLLRMKGAAVVGVYHPLIDEKLVRILHRRRKKVYAWTVDDVNSMQKMLVERVDAVVTSDPTLLQRLMQDTRTQCLEGGFSFSQ